MQCDQENKREIQIWEKSRIAIWSSYSDAANAVRLWLRTLFLEPKKIAKLHKKLMDGSLQPERFEELKNWKANANPYFRLNVVD